jgi:hypothetical protein
VDALHERALNVYLVRPRTSARSRENYLAATRKIDRFDAFVLVDTLRTLGWRWRPLLASIPVTE